MRNARQETDSASAEREASTRARLAGSDEGILVLLHGVVEHARDVARLDQKFRGTAEELGMGDVLDLEERATLWSRLREIVR